MNVHFHTLAVDGVFVRAPDGSLSFAAANAPTDEEVDTLFGVIRTRMLRLLVRPGLLCDDASDDLDESPAPPLHVVVASRFISSMLSEDRASNCVGLLSLRFDRGFELGAAALDFCLQ